ncbi:hypothetical protein HMPREF3209_01849 [Lactobacillus crispatus]|jgi:hypothetical protein|nr:hypothetical protein HMPREF3209_01849 [Lactobacillus crispatus]
MKQYRMETLWEIMKAKFLKAIFKLVFIIFLIVTTEISIQSIDLFLQSIKVSLGLAIISLIVFVASVATIYLCLHVIFKNTKLEKYFS